MNKNEFLPTFTFTALLHRGWKKEQITKLKPFIKRGIIVINKNKKITKDAKYLVEDILAAEKKHGVKVIPMKFPRESDFIQFVDQMITQSFIDKTFNNLFKEETFKEACFNVEKIKEFKETDQYILFINAISPIEEKLVEIFKRPLKEKEKTDLIFFCEKKSGLIDLLKK